MNNKKNPLGIYVHIPFCDKKCDYCDFLSGPASKQTKEEYTKALLAEINAYKDLMKDYLVRTIFIGGGTPSSIESKYIQQILEAISKNFNLEPEEISIEANPGTLSKEKLKAYKDAGINRLSLGLQSTNNQELKLLGRIHTYEDFLENYHLARELGFSNINIDLMSGLPSQGVKAWEETIERVVALGPEHISAYSLIIEEGTPFYDRYGNQSEDDIDEHGNNEINEDTDRLIYSKTKEILEANGYCRYEISNYAKKGYECKHNKSYWERVSYLGLGLGSSSLIKDLRFHNEENLSNYIKNSSKPSLLQKDIIKLSKEEAMEEFMFLGLRLTKGVSKSKFHQEFGIPIEDIFLKQVKQSIQEGVLEEDNNFIRLTEYGLDVSNHVLARFLLSSP